MAEPRLNPTAAQDGTYLGFDFGEKNIGVAVGQLITGTASGLETIHVFNKEAKWTAVERLVGQWRPCAFVVGLSHQPDGSTNPITISTLRFCRQLEGRFRLQVHVMDEQLSTMESRTVFYSHRGKQSSQFGRYKDQIAAQLILQSWLAQQLSSGTGS
jgi:putative Holliday junction resolvase